MAVRTGGSTRPSRDRDRQVLVEIKMRANRSRSWHEAIYERYRAYRKDRRSAALLLITPDPIYPAGRTLMAEHDDMVIIQVTGHEEDTRTCQFCARQWAI
jgi:hypothetical protein